MRALLLLTALLAQPLHHPKGEFIAVNGARLWVESEGTGEPLILIAGGPGFSHAYFHPFFSTLSNTHRVIYYDALGCGASERPASPNDYTLERAVEDLEGLRKALKLETLNILGHSYGGFVAQDYALKHPRSVKRLILMGTFASGDLLQVLQDGYNYEVQHQLPEVWDKLTQLRAKGFKAASKEHQEAYTITPAFSYFYNPDNVAKLPLTDPNLYNPDPWFAMGGDDADFVVTGPLARWDVRKRLPEMKMPMLILGGRFDRQVPPNVTLSYKTLAPQAEFLMLEKSGHFPFIEEPDATFAALRRFLAK